MASLAGKKKISQTEMSQEINLRRYLGRDATPEEVRLFADLAVEKINDRTLDGKTIHGGNFKRYSEKYADEKGVSRDSVDLFLSGSMLDSVVSNPAGGNTVRIEIDDSLDTAKGYNHQTGDTLPKRPWFGLTTKEAREIADNIKSDDIQRDTITLAQLRDALAVLGISQEE